MLASLKRKACGLGRRIRGGAAASPRWPAIPQGVHLSPSEADMAAYRMVPLSLTWSAANGGNTIEWQARARAKLSELLGLALTVATDAAPILGEEAVLGGGLRRRTVYLPVARLRHAPVTVVWDPAASNEPRPVMICLQGHTSGAHISWGESRVDIDDLRLRNGGDYAIQAVAHGYVAVCIEQVAFGESGERKVAHRWEHPCVDACNRALLLGRTLLGDRVRDVSATIDWLASGVLDLPRIDPNSVHAMGNSAGGETALFATAIDPRISAVIASGCVGSYRLASGARRTCPDTVVPGILNWMEYEDVIALCAPRKVLVISGRDDHIYPFHLAASCAESALPAFAALDSAQSLRVSEGPAGHRFYPDLAWPAFLEMTEQSAHDHQPPV